MALTIPFTKYHGLGNDFVVIDAVCDPALSALDWPAHAPRLCDRRTGIGADGILIVTNAADQSADVAMHIVNSDGSRAQMCGNGLRCIAMHMVERRKHPSPNLRVHTGRGVLSLRCKTRQSGTHTIVEAVTVDMGPPIFDAPQIPVDAPGPSVLNTNLQDLGSPAHTKSLQQVAEALRPFALESTITLSCVSMGNPHAIFFLKSLSDLPLENLGPRIETLPVFPEKTNVHFVHVHTDPHRAVDADMITWERGAGATHACGTGACAVHAAGAITGRLGRTSRLRLPGGVLEITWDPRQPASGVLMKGPASRVYEGVLELPT